MNKKDNYFLLIIICIILFCVLGLLYLDKQNSNNVEENKTKYKLLNDYSRFFTVNNCVSKYVSLIGKKETKYVLDILDEEYVKNNKITSDNLYNYVGDYNGIYSFSSLKIYYKDKNDNYITYYVYGNLIQDSIDDENVSKEKKYYIVNFDLNNNLFSIIPYDENSFKEIENNE